MFLGIEIGGTKLQLALGRGDGSLKGIVRRKVQPGAGAVGIRRQILEAYPELLATAEVDASQVQACGIGFGGPVDLKTRSVITSHQIADWDGFPLAEWAEEKLTLKTVIANDADTAGLGETSFGAGQGCDPIFYMTVGSGIGGGLIVGGRIYAGVGRGAAEIGHLYLDGDDNRHTLEQLASGWAIERAAGCPLPELAKRAEAGDKQAGMFIRRAVQALSEALVHVIALLCPERIIIGGGVSLIGETLFFAPLRELVDRHTFTPFRGLTSIVPAALGEEVVLHGALALADQA